MDYKEKIIEIIEKALRDELSAGAFYLRQAEEIVGYDDEEVSEKLREHGKEEFEHFAELLAFAGKFGLLSDIKLGFDDLSETMLNRETDSINAVIEKLEKDAYSDYKEASMLALEQKDLETHEFFKELMGDEASHLDDFLLFQGKARTLGESKKCSSKVKKDKISAKPTGGKKLKDYLKKD